MPMTSFVGAGRSPSSVSNTSTKTGTMKRSMKMSTSVAKLRTTAG